jgi:hypothetical protein
MPTLRFSHVLLVDDFFRSAANGLESYVTNRRFLRGFFETALRRLGLPLREEAALSEGGRVDVARIMNRLGLPLTPAGWARACSADLTPALGLDGMPAFGPGCLVIGWGLTPALQRCIDRSGAAYLDVEIDPVRFTAHLHFCARSNDPAIAAALGARRVDEELFWNHATAAKAYFSRRGAASLFDERLRVGLFFGQSLVDLSLVSGGRMMHPAGAVAALRTLAESVDLLVIKPHPYEPALHGLAPIARAIPNVAWTQENTYALLSAANVQFASSLSSSVLAEARYFMKPARALIRADRNAAELLPRNASAWVTVGPEIGSLNFMAAACGAASPPAAAAWPAATIERAFSTRWGLDEQNPGLRSLPEAAFGRAYTFRVGSPAIAWLSHGWSVPDDTGVWSEGELACLVIPLPESGTAGSQRIEVRIDYHSVSSATSIYALVDGMVVPGQRGAGARRRSAVFVLAPSSFPDAAEGNRKCLVVQFAIGDPPPRVGDAGIGAKLRGRRPPARRPGLTLKKLRMSLRPAELVVAAPPVAPALATTQQQPRIVARLMLALAQSARWALGQEALRRDAAGPAAMRPGP